MNLKDKFPNVDKSWTLFLDRDGVLNQFLPDQFVTYVSDFIWVKGSQEFIVQATRLFGKIIVVTNQQAIGKGLMTAIDLEQIHFKMQEDISELGGKIDRFYYCPHQKEINCSCRKPKIELALKAKHDFPEIDFKKSIMIGDSLSDMEFGKNLNMKCILVSNNKNINLDYIQIESLAELEFNF